MNRNRKDWIPKPGGTILPVQIIELISEQEKAGRPLAPICEPIWMTYEESLAAGTAHTEPKPPTPPGPTS